MTREIKKTVMYYYCTCNKLPKNTLIKVKQTFQEIPLQLRDGYYKNLGHVGGTIYIAYIHLSPLPSAFLLSFPTPLLCLHVRRVIDHRCSEGIFRNTWWHCRCFKLQ